MLNVFPAGDGTYFRGLIPAGQDSSYKRAFYKPQVVVQYPFNLSVGPTPPEDPEVGDVWIDTS
jgi:hypothetical protein